MNLLQDLEDLLVKHSSTAAYRLWADLTEVVSLHKVVLTVPTPAEETPTVSETLAPGPTPTAEVTPTPTSN